MNPNYFEQPENVEKILQAASSQQLDWIMEQLKEFLPENAKLLELGSGAGHDFHLLSKHYQATGSDFSTPLLAACKSRFPQSEFLLLDAIHIDTDLTFDAIYSNKVLPYLGLTELEKSLLRQADVLLPEGIVCHSFWHGEEAEETDGLVKYRYLPDMLAEVFEMNYEVLRCEIYTDAAPDDSILVIARKTD
ncbi:methyltransferase domain-containing protein [bacterium]|nr:methyltransferase domain-containing protein [bacterium]